MTRRFRFGVQVNTPVEGLSWGESARRLEELGFSTLVLPDHFDDDPPEVRIERLREPTAILRGLFSEGPVNFTGQHYSIQGLEGLPKPVQTPPPLLLGGGGKRMLTLAAQQADIVGISGNLRAGVIGPRPK